jgi:hypothetical protein
MLPHSSVGQAKQVDILQLASRYVQLKRVTASDYAGACPVCGGTDRFGVNTRKQVFNCRGCGAKGDVIALVRHVEGLPFREAVEHLTGEQPVPSKPRPCPEEAPKRQPEDDANQHVLRVAAHIVGGRGPVWDSPGKEYLSVARKIDADAIADVLQSTDAIGWNPDVLFREPGHALDGKRLGAIIGIMTDPVTAKPTGGISRTYIGPAGKKVGKAKNLGPAGIVRLTPDEDVTHGLFLAEGLETALAAMSKGLRPAWSTGSTSIMAKIPVFGGVESITILADHDENGAGERAAHEAERRWREAGREVRVWVPATRGDFNDEIMRGPL